MSGGCLGFLNHQHYLAISLNCRNQLIEAFFKASFGRTDVIKGSKEWIAGLPKAATIVRDTYYKMSPYDPYKWSYEGPCKSASK